MTIENRVQQEIKEKWDDKNEQGIILFRSDTLKIRTVQHQDMQLELVHNSSRDVYDKSAAKPIPQPKKACPFCGELDNELLTTGDGASRVLGNKFACMQYQCLLIPARHEDSITRENLRGVFEFAFAHPGITFLVNSANAGKTVEHLYWLVSFHRYENLVDPAYRGELIHETPNVSICRRTVPSYGLEIQTNDVDDAVRVLYQLIEFMGHKNFNLFIYENRILFIPRENKEIPDGFGNHRFGGLEMIGVFIMKSEDEYYSVDPGKLSAAISQISFKEPNQKKIEEFAISIV